MNELMPQIMDEIKQAMKQRDSEKLLCLRTLHSDIKNASIQEGREIDDEMVIKVCQKSVKQRKDSIDQFSQAGRDDLVLKETRQLELISAYLPQAMSEQELENQVKQAISETGAESKKDMGKVMKTVLPRVQGRADGKQVSAMVSRLLN